MENIYKVKKSFARDIYWIGFIPLVMLYIFYGFIIPIFGYFKQDLSYAVHKFISNQKEVFSHEGLANIKSLVGYFLFYIICFMSFYYPIRKCSKQVKLSDNKFEVKLFNNKVVNSKYEDVEEVLYNRLQMFIKIKGQKEVHIINDLIGYEKLCKFFTNKVKSLGGKVKEIDEE